MPLGGSMDLESKFMSLLGTRLPIKIETIDGNIYATAEWLPDDDGQFRYDAYTKISAQNMSSIVIRHLDLMEWRGNNVFLKALITAEDAARIKAGYIGATMGISFVDIEINA